MFVIVLLAWFFSLITAWILRHTVIKGAPTPFIMELPPYRLPTLRGVMTHTWDRVWQYIKKAGTVILAASILMWVLMTFPRLPSETVRTFENQRRAIHEEMSLVLKNGDPTGTACTALGEKQKLIDDAESRAALEYTIAGRTGRFLEPITQLAGFDWHINIALIGAFTAKEVFVSTMATVYSMRSSLDGDDSAALRAGLAADPAFSRPAVYSLIVFLLLYAPCMVTVAAIIRETSWRWGFFTLYGSLIYSFVLSIAVYQISRLFF